MPSAIYFGFGAACISIWSTWGEISLAVTELSAVMVNMMPLPPVVGDIHVPEMPAGAWGELAMKPGRVTV